MKMTYGELREMVLGVIKEQNVSGAVGGYNTPRAFSGSSKPYYRKVSRPKRPSHTKMFDYLEEKKNK